MSKFTEHDNWTRCQEFLPKPKRRHKGLISQCSYCGRLYTAQWGYDDRLHWEETTIRRERKNK